LDYLLDMIVGLEMIIKGRAHDLQISKEKFFHGRCRRSLSRDRKEKDHCLKEKIQASLILL
jgi:hypothetical protein